jgi:chromosome segregation ATPase
MNILGLFHALSPELVQKMDSDLKESQAACERQHKTLVSLGTALKQLYADKDELTKHLGESISYGCELQQKVSDATRRAGDAILLGANLRKLLDAAEEEVETQRRKVNEVSEFHARRESTLKGQITKLKKRLANG